MVPSCYRHRNCKGSALGGLSVGLPCLAVLSDCPLRSFRQPLRSASVCLTCVGSLSLRFLPSSRFAPSKPHSEKLTSNLLRKAAVCLSVVSLRSALRVSQLLTPNSSLLTPFLSCFRSSARPISIGKLQHCCSFTADLSPHRL